METESPIPEKSPVEKAREILQEDAEKRGRACLEEIEAVLKKHGCALIVVHRLINGDQPLAINGVPAGFLIRPLAPTQ